MIFSKQLHYKVVCYLQEFEEKGMVLPQHLKEHAPRKEHTEEQLAYVSAEMYHTAKNVGKMLASLNRLSSIQDRVDFLRKHHNHHNEYMSHAAKILRDNGNHLMLCLSTC